MSELSLVELTDRIGQCRLCAAHLDPNPVLRVSKTAGLLIVGQAPGRRVHVTGVPWNDPSGDRLRDWMQVDRETFYDSRRIAIVPRAFCYPGKGKSGDLPPPPICAETWHEALLERMPAIRLTLLVGQYAQQHYLHLSERKTLTEIVAAFDTYLTEGYFPLPHPSPRNTLWLKKNPWFTERVLPCLRQQVHAILASTS